MRGNRADNRSMRRDISARDLYWNEIYVEGFGTVTICRHCGNAIEVGHAVSCPVCKRNQH